MNDRLKMIHQRIKDSSKINKDSIVKFINESCVLASDAETEERINFVLGKILSGDIVFCTKGLYLVTDNKPKVEDPGKCHFRAIKVQIDEQGQYVICGETRSVIFSENEAFRIRKSTFDMKRVEHCSYDRYLSYRRINEINAELSSLREK